MGKFPFDTIIANNNLQLPIPPKYKYKYITVDQTLKNTKQPFTLVQADIINQKFPIYHDSEKLAKVVSKNI
jgi:hypothetical protein